MALNATETAAHGRRCRPFKHICTDTVLTWVLCHRSHRGSKLSIFETHRHCDALTELILTHRAASRVSLSFARKCGPKLAGLRIGSYINRWNRDLYRNGHSYYRAYSAPPLPSRVNRLQSKSRVDCQPLGLESKAPAILRTTQFATPGVRIQVSEQIVRRTHPRSGKLSMRKQKSHTPGVAN